LALPELVTTTPEQYEDLGVELAGNPRRLAGIRQKLADNRLTKPLFDTKYFTNRIEAAYTRVFERYQADLPPEHIHIAAGC
jgi:predicted O-linked N-acetylglucosamine transferase (SPINDLY family)